jgi:hypothetical protein
MSYFVLELSQNEFHKFNLYFFLHRLKKFLNIIIYIFYSFKKINNSSTKFKDKL